MASKLCCTAEQEGRSASPELPNARISQAPPTTSPLLTKTTASPSSRFTSAGSGELHELRDIFDAARGQTPQTHRPRFSRPSIRSLRSLHKMASMRSIIKQKFSKDGPQQHRDESHKRCATMNVITSKAPSTTIKQPNEGLTHQLTVAKTHLRETLLSSKTPAEGDYDLDAEVLDNVAKNMGRKTPGKRPSIHSIEWTPSTGSKPTPGSSTKGCDSAELKRNLQPYHLLKPQSIPLELATSFGQILSVPNLKVDALGESNIETRRSHSATSMALPKPFPISPLRLPSLSTYDGDGTPWLEVVHQSLRLSQFPVPPRVRPKASETCLDHDSSSRPGRDPLSNYADITMFIPNRAQLPSAKLSARAVDIQIQQQTSKTSPRTSASARGSIQEQSILDKKEDEEDDSSRSVHLYSMRISHHLRSGSLLSWDQLANAPELPTPSHLFRERAVSDQRHHSQTQRQLPRHERQISSSGFASSKVPSKWGKVLPTDQEIRADIASSIYSSRPQSTPNSFGESMVNLSQTGPNFHIFNFLSTDIKNSTRSNSYPEDYGATSKFAQQPGVTGFSTAEGFTTDSNIFVAPNPFLRKKSIAETKSSKFREEFIPSPPKRRVPPSSSIIKFFNPKRLSMRSQSEANLQSESSNLAVDGPFDTLNLPIDKERRQSRSLISLKVEQEALGNNKGADHVWDRALKAHQEEKAAMFRSDNKSLALDTNPFRERSGSIAVKRESIEEDGSQTVESPNVNATTVMESPFAYAQPFELLPMSLSRRSAPQSQPSLDSGGHKSAAFERPSHNSRIAGAWGRYPSHTRHDRTFSAGKLDRVDTRDFALEDTIKFASANNESHDEDMVDPTARLPSSQLLPDEKKKRKKVGSGRMAKSNSMTFGKTLIKNYTKMFKSQSTEFQRHGRGHRSSIASGGILEFPELELVPDIWSSNQHEQERTGRHHFDDKNLLRQARHTITKGKGKLRVEDSMATLRPGRNSSVPNLNELSFHDGANDLSSAQDRARIWSVYYDDCLPVFPRASTDRGLGLDDFESLARWKLDHKRAHIYPHTMQAHLKYSDNTSHLSCVNTSSRERIQPISRTMADDESAGDEKSIVSVRRSTMDLISKFKEQEITEHERVLSLTGTELCRAPDMTR